MKRFYLRADPSLVVRDAFAHSALAQSTVGLRLFETKCASCHQGAQDQKAPDASVLRKMTPEAVYAAFAKNLTRRSQDCRTTTKRRWRLIWAAGRSG